MSCDNISSSYIYYPYPVHSLCSSSQRHSYNKLHLLCRVNDPFPLSMPYSFPFASQYAFVNVTRYTVSFFFLEEQKCKFEYANYKKKMLKSQSQRIFCCRYSWTRQAYINWGSRIRNNRIHWTLIKWPYPFRYCQKR